MTSSFLRISVLLFFAAVATVMGQALDPAELLKDFEQQMTRRNFTEAISTATKIIALQPKSAAGYAARGRAYSESAKYEKAIEDYSAALELTPKSGELCYQRGSEYLRIGKVDEALADLNRLLELYPHQQPSMWQRGIALYELGRFDDAARQFVSHQMVNSNDVENAAWHFASVARGKNIEEAQKALLPIKEDRRIPLMQVYALFQGKATPEVVFATAHFGYPKPEELNRRLFYGSFYVGLYYEAKGDLKKAEEYMNKAIEKAPAKDYMADLAKVHVARLKSSTKTKKQ